MDHRVGWAPSARRDMARLPVKTALAVLTYVEQRLASNPARLGKPLAGDLAHLHSARNGDYRILFSLDADATTITIIRVDHRAHVYRPH